MSQNHVDGVTFRPHTWVSVEPRVLVLFAHPMPARSRLNRRFVEAIGGVPGVTVHDLYEAYPDQWIDVAEEQRLLTLHDTIVFQHPFYWYSTPALLKEWQDQVLTFGWAYGPGGTALRGKRFLSALTTGGTAEAYTPEGMHGTTIEALLAPIRQTARLCGMTWMAPHVTHGSHRLDEATIAEATARYRAAIEQLAAPAVTA